MDSTHTGVINSTAVQIARDTIAGDMSDYYFWCSSDNTYLLVRYEESEELQSGIQLNDCTVTRIVYRPSDWQQNITADWFVETYEQQTILFVNPDHELYYSSEKNAPHLIEGGDYFAALSCVLLMCIICFSLARRIMHNAG